MTNLTIWVLALPLLGFIILGLAGRALTRTGILTVALGTSGLAFLFAALGFLSMLGAPPTSPASGDQVFYTWVISGVIGTIPGVPAGAASGGAPFTISFGLLFDPLSATMLMIVTGVGLLIHIYSAGYMEDDPCFWRFFCFMNFFIFAMVMLVTADNFLFLLVGWGLVGLASFLLIGFWYQRPSAVAAAQKALVINVIGDFGLMIGIFLIFKQFTVLNYVTNPNGVIGVFNSIDPSLKGQFVATAIALCLFLAC